MGAVAPECDDPYVLRNKWFEPRHMHHLVRRWHRDHTDELHLAWLNGVGVVVWENVFGSWNPWSGDNQDLLRQMRPLQRNLGDVFSEGQWAPLVATSRSGVHASRWEVDGLRPWTVVNATDQRVQGKLVPIDVRPGESYWDLLSGTSTRPDLANGAPALSGAIGSQGIAAFAATAGSHQRQRLAAVLEHRRRSDHLARPVRGSSGPAPLADVAYPQLHQCIEEARSVVLEPFAIDLRPVSNGDFLRFLEDTRYAPATGTTS